MRAFLAKPVSVKTLMIFALVFMCGTLAPVKKSSASEGGTRIAVIDVQNLLNELKAAKNVQEQIQKKRKALQDEFSKKERDLRDEQENIIKNAKDKSPEDLKKERIAFEKKLLDMRKLVQEEQRKLEKAANDALQTLRMEILKIVADIADDKKYDIVLSRQNVVLADKGMEISDQVMKELNKSLKKIKLDIE